MNASTSMSLCVLCLIAGCGDSDPPGPVSTPRADAPTDARPSSPELAAFPTNSDGRPEVVDPQLRALNRLVGRWRITDDADGEVEYQWLEGGRFLVQRVDFKRPRGRIRGVEVIGYLQPFGKPRSRDIMSRWYDAEGNTFDYVYAIEGDTLNIWGGERGSGAHYVGHFTPDGNKLIGKWTFPNGGGYSTTATRIQ